MYYKKRGREEAKNQGDVNQRFHITDQPNPQWTSQDDHNPEDTSAQSGDENSSNVMAISNDYQVSDPGGLRQTSTKLQPPPECVNIEEGLPSVHSAENRTASETTEITSAELQHEFLSSDSVRKFSEKSVYVNEDTTETQCRTADNGNEIKLSENDPVYDNPLLSGESGDISKQNKQVKKNKQVQFNTLLSSSSVSITSNPSYVPLVFGEYLDVHSPCLPWEQEYVVVTTTGESPDPLQLEIEANPSYIPSEQGGEAEGGYYDYVPEDRVFFKLPVHNPP